MASVTPLPASHFFYNATPQVTSLYLLELTSLRFYAGDLTAAGTSELQQRLLVDIHNS